jgi:hypothetical protein
VVEHPLGKGEVDSSILSGSTIFSITYGTNTKGHPIGRHSGGTDRTGTD